MTNGRVKIVVIDQYAKNGSLLELFAAIALRRMANQAVLPDKLNMECVVQAKGGH